MPEAKVTGGNETHQVVDVTDDGLLVLDLHAGVAFDVTVAELGAALRQVIAAEPTAASGMKLKKVGDVYEEAV